MAWSRRRAACARSTSSSRNVQLVNVLTCEIYPADIGIYGDRIAVVGAAGAYDLEGRSEIDGTGKWACPGFFDAHLHIESTMVTPANYAAGCCPAAPPRR